MPYASQWQLRHPWTYCCGMRTAGTVTGRMEQMCSLIALSKHGSVVIEACDFGLFGDRDDGVCLEACWNDSLCEGEVENVC